MKQYNSANIRNIVVSGHAGSGKTSLIEAMLFNIGLTDRLGKILDGNTYCDFDPEEIKRKASVSTALAPLEWKNTKLNLIDVPGLFDFEGGVCEGMRAADTALIILSGKSGVSVGAEKAYISAEKYKKAVMFFISKLDSESADFFKVFSGLRDSFGTKVVPVIIPYVVDHKVQCYINLLTKKAYTYSKGKAAETAVPAEMEDVIEEYLGYLTETVAESSDELMEKFFEGEVLTEKELIDGLADAVKQRIACPVFCGSSTNLEAIDLILDGIKDLAVAADNAEPEIAVDASGNEIEIKASESDPTVAVVFKTVADPFIGKLSYFKVVSGKMTPDVQMFNPRTGSNEKVGKLLTVRGKKQEDAPYVAAGDIGAVAKLLGVITGDTLCAAGKNITLSRVDFPEPTLSMAVKPKAKGEEDKIAAGLSRLLEEDPTITLVNNTETRQLILSGLGEQHLDVIASKLKSKFGVDMILEAPKVPYRETIRKKVKVEGRHKKQTGGHGQFGHVWIEFEPCDSDDLVFEDKIFGGSVPKGFFPAVEKGLRDCILNGILAGYPVVGLKATLVDGSYHPVDSSEMSFKLAAALAYKAGLPQASPTILEPIASLKILIPESNMGDIIGEINKLRGHVLGMNAADNGLQQIDAEAPMAEISGFSTTIRSITQGRGSFTLKFERYEEAPPMIVQKVIDDSKSNE